jgi:hypothetical protein
MTKTNIPTDYRIVRKGEHYPYQVKARNPRTGRWEVHITTDDLQYVEQWIASRREQCD